LTTRKNIRTDGVTPILYVIDAMSAGGGPAVCYDLATGIDRSLFRPCIVTLFEKGELGERIEDEGIPILNLEVHRPFTIASVIRFVPQIVAFARDQRVEIVHAHLVASGLYGFLAVRLLRVPCIFTAHGALAKQRLLRVVEVCIRNLYTKVVAVSQNGAEETRRISLRNRSRVEFIRNGVNASYWRSDAGDRKDGDGFHIVMVANFFKEKDHICLLKAFELFRGRHSCSRLLLIGDGERRQSTEEWVRKKGIGGVYFLGALRDIKTHLDRADLFVLSSFTEGISIAMLEAMSMGLPVVASRVGAMEEVITDGKDGLLVEAGAYEEMCAAMERIALDADLRAALSCNARARVVNDFSLQATVAAYQKLYLELEK
jgi:glycosyltransferase involved in cell wall biosynthesis